MVWCRAFGSENVTLTDAMTGLNMADLFKFGIEEEFFLVDADTKSAARAMPAAFLAAAKAATGGQVSGELLQSQVEIATLPHTDMATAREELRLLRQTVAKVAAEHGLAILAAGTHPTAVWRDMQQTESERYDAVMHDLQMIGQRNMLCGMHVHVELPDPDDRVDVMTRMLPYLPLFVALATSSPFWNSRPTGLKGYRLAAYDELPRTGVPELFRTKEEFDAYVAALVRAGVMEDASFVWWAIRPSLEHPTLELRAPDCCTLVEDTIAIAALYRVLARYLTRNPLINQDIDAVKRAIVVENKWRAQRYGVHGTLVSEIGAVSVAEMLDQLIEEIAPDAAALGCLPQLRHCRAIVCGGTSADSQLAVFAAHGRSGSHARAMRAVTDWIATATLQ
jgi:carboxylate-amine ligase